MQLFFDHPLTGSGLDTFGLARPGVLTPEYGEVEWGFVPGKAHNDFLHALADQGILGVETTVRGGEAKGPLGRRRPRRTALRRHRGRVAPRDAGGPLSQNAVTPRTISLVG